jgi:hypothetical protein
VRGWLRSSRIEDQRVAATAARLRVPA